MFSEYFETKKPVDDMAKDWKSKTENKDVFTKIFQKKEKPEQSSPETLKKQAENSKDQIQKWINFLKENPNSLNPKETSYPSLQQAFSDSMAAGFGQSNEKILWFTKTLPDWKTISVRWWEDEFLLDIQKSISDNWKEYIDQLKISFSNFLSQKILDQWWAQWTDQLDGQPQFPNMNIDGNISLLDQNIKDQNIVSIINAIEKNIMRPERETVHWYSSKQQEKEAQSRQIDDFHVFLCELQFNPQKNNQEMLKYITNPDNFNDNQSLDYRQIIKSLCVLCRHSTITEIIRNLDIPKYNENDKPQDNQKTLTTSESVIEYLTNASDSELSWLIKNKNKLINLAKEI